MVLAYFVPWASGLSSHKAISEYIRDQWSAAQGFPDGPVYAMAQTPDGYLWIGTEKGLVRFDGLSFRLFQQFDSTTLPGGPVIGLAVDAEGDLWIRLQGPRLLNYRDGTFRDVLSNPAIVETDITAMCAGSRVGSIAWAKSQSLSPGWTASSKAFMNKFLWYNKKRFHR